MSTKEIAIFVGVGLIVYFAFIRKPASGGGLVSDNTGGDVPAGAGDASSNGNGGGAPGNPTPDGNSPGGLGETGG